MKGDKHRFDQQDKYSEGWERVFGKKKCKCQEKCDGKCKQNVNDKN